MEEYQELGNRIQNLEKRVRNLNRWINICLLGAIIAVWCAGFALYALNRLQP